MVYFSIFYAFYIKKFDAKFGHNFFPYTIIYIFFLHLFVLISLKSDIWENKNKIWFNLSYVFSCAKEVIDIFSHSAAILLDHYPSFFRFFFVFVMASYSTTPLFMLHLSNFHFRHVFFLFGFCWFFFYYNFCKHLLTFQFIWNSTVWC